MTWQRGRGGGREWGWCGIGFTEPVYASPAASRQVYYPEEPILQGDKLKMLKQEKEYLDSEMEQLKNAVEDIAKKILELEKEE